MIGADCKLFIGDANTSAGDTEVAKVRDNELSLKASEVDVSSRAGGGWKDFVQGLKEWAASFDVLHDPTDAGWVKLRDAFRTGAKTGISILDGPLATGKGAEGKCVVTEFTKGEPLDGALTDKITIKGCGAPTWKD